ncbi:MAG: PAS domain-containing protein [Paracoccus sp. (in: a-proteobacteria)]
MSNDLEDMGSAKPAHRDNGTHRDGDNIVQLNPHGAPDPARILADLRSYWDSLRRGRAVPDRTDVEPGGIRSALDYAFILERIAPGAARFRLAGRHLVDLMGMEVRGMPVCSLLQSGSRGRLSDVLETVFKGPQIAEIVLQSNPQYSRPPLTGRMLFLPLKSDLGDITRALGCLVSEGEIGHGPRRFDITEDTVFPVIDGARPIQPHPNAFHDEMAPWRVPSRTQGEAPTARAPDHGETPDERRARFRVVPAPDPV